MRNPSRLLKLTSAVVGLLWFSLVLAADPATDPVKITRVETITIRSPWGLRLPAQLHRVQVRIHIPQTSPGR